MANRHLVASGTWDGTNTAIWAATMGGASGASAPTSSDDVFVDAGSPASPTLSISNGAAARDVTLGAPSSGNLALSGTGQLNVFGSWWNYAGMIRLYTGQITFSATSTGKAITTSGVTFASNLIFNSATGGWTLGGSLTNPTGNINMLSNGGAIDTASHPVSLAAFVVGISCSLVLGSTVYTGGNWSCSTAANLSATSSTLNLGSNQQFIGGGKNYGIVTLIGASTAMTLDAFTASAVSVTNNASKIVEYQISGNITVSGLFAVNGDSAINRILLRSSVIGTPRTISAGSVSLANADWADITGAGAAAWTGTSMGDCLGNSNITFDPSTTQTATGTGSFTWSTHGWTSRVPLPQDDVAIPNAFIANRIITVDMPRLCRNITITATGNPAFTRGSCSIYGSWIGAAGMTNPGASGMEFRGRGSHTIQSNGVVWGTGANTQTYGPGSYTLADAFPGAFVAVINIGTFSDGGFSPIFRVFQQTTASAVVNRTVAWIIAGSGTVWAATAGTVNDTGSVKFTDTTPAVKAFSGGKTYNNVWFSGTGPFLFTGSNTFARLDIDPGLVVRHTAGTTQTVTTPLISGRAPIAGDAAYGLLDGASGSYFSTPDSAPLSITGDLGLVWDGRLADWTPAVANMLIAKRASGGVSGSYTLAVAAGTGVLAYSWNDGSALNTKNSTVAPTVTDGARLCVKVEHDVNNGASGNDVRFYTAPTAAGPFVQLGATVTTAGITSIVDSTDPVEIGSQLLGTNGPATGKAYRAQVYNGIAGTLVADFDPSLWTIGNTFVAATGETWTRNGNAMISADHLTTIQGLAAATWSMVKAGGGIVGADYLALRNNTVTPGSTWYAGAHSLDGGSNSGWGFFPAFDYACIHVDGPTTPAIDLALSTPSITMAMEEC